MELSMVVLQGLTIALTELFKQLKLNDRFTPIFALSVGLALTAIGAPIVEITGGWREIVLIGLQNGLIAMGLYSGVKAVAVKHDK